MAMRTATPWWASLITGVGLLFFLLGERFFGHLSGPRFFLTGIGVVLILGITAARVWALLGSAGARQRVERTLLLTNLGIVLSMLLYIFSGDWGSAKLGLTETGAAHFSGAMTVIYLVVLVASVIPLFIIELSLGLALRTTFDIQRGPGNEEAGVEYFRVRELGWSGLSLALALAFLMVTCQVAGERNAQRDVSYFKTSAPGESTTKIVETSSEPIRVLMFFPDPNGVKDQVKGYFDTLASRTSKIAVEQHDRLIDAELAGKYKVTKDGAVVLVRGTGDKEKSEKIDLDPDIAKSRSSSSKLRNLDREVNQVLLKLVRDKRKAYLLTGHGEINDRESVPSELKTKVPERRITAFKRALAENNYESKNLGLVDLARDVPDDANIVIVLAPSIGLEPAEWASLERYLDRGGRLMYALDPTSEPSMGPLEGKLGVKMVPGSLTDEVQFLPQRGVRSDRRFAITNQFSSHASITTLSRTVDKGLVLIDAGALEDVPPQAGVTRPNKTYTIRSMDSSFLDLNENFAFDAAGDKPEKKQRWNIAAALEGPKQGEKDGYRAIVFSDVDLFADAFAQSSLGRATVILVSGPLLENSLKWLGGEEAIVGDVVSEDDKPIQHTKNEDAVWFTLMIFGVPLLVLTLGLVSTTARRRKSSKKTEVTP